MEKQCHLQFKIKSFCFFFNYLKILISESSELVVLFDKSIKIQHNY